MASYTFLVAAALLYSAGALKEHCYVGDFGAIGDNATDDTLAIQKAIDECNHVVLEAPGVYLSKPLELHSDFIFEIASNATLTVWRDLSTYPFGHPGFLWVNTAILTTNLTITGPGMIDGQGWRWWPRGKSGPRPNLISLQDMQDLVLHNITLRDSPAWNTNLRGERMTITHVRIESGLDNCGGYNAAPNTDGINIGGRHIYIADSWIHNGDDCIPTNVFRTDRLGLLDSYNITAERVHCECGTNGGVAIIQSGNATVRDVVYRDMTVNHTNAGCGMKISEAYETVLGQVVNVTWENIHVLSPRLAGIYINVVQENPGDCTNTTAQPPHWLTATNITYRNITGSGVKSGVAGNFCCSASRPCTGLELIDVDFDRSNSYKVENVKASHSRSSVPVPPF